MRDELYLTRKIIPATETAFMGISVPAVVVTATDSYVAGDGITPYVAEDGSTFYVQE